MEEKRELISLIESESDINVIHFLYQYTRDFMSLHSFVRTNELFEEARPSDQQ